MSRVLSVDAVLEIWERVAELPALDRALTIWSLVEPQRSIEQLASEPLGARDRALIELRVANFGAAAPCYVECPECETAIEFDFDLEQVIAREPVIAKHELELELDGVRWQLCFRLPSTADLRSALARAPSRAALQVELIERCVGPVVRAGQEFSEAPLPEAIVTAIVEEMGRRDPIADIGLRVSCSSCGHEWSAPFDIASYLWRELELQATQTLREVDALARSYGWSEAEILGLSSRRRRVYLEVLGLR